MSRAPVAAPPTPPPAQPRIFTSIADLTTVDAKKTAVVCGGTYGGHTTSAWRIALRGKGRKVRPLNE